MATHKSAEKRYRQSEKKRARNAALKSRTRTAMKDARAAFANKAKDKDQLLKQAISAVERAKSKGILRSNTASRYVSRLMRAASAAQA